jgi:molecular chaperone DnaK
METMNKEIIIGIDLGTTNSEVSLIHKGKATVLKVDGSKIIPSVVSVGGNGEVLRKMTKK